MYKIKEGDIVKHRTNHLINGGLEMSVVDIEDNKALVAHFEGREGIHKETWFDMSELEVLKYGDGRFTDAGK